MSGMAELLKSGVGKRGGATSYPAPLVSLWLSFWLRIESEDDRQGVLNPHRRTALPSRSEFRLAHRFEGRFIGSASDTPNDPGVLDVPLLIHNELDIDP